jgi:hypothetical protein
MAVEIISTYVQGYLAACQPADQTAALLQDAIRTANEAIWTKARAHRRLRGMGTTVVLALCQGEQISLAHVGDSRAYLLHSGVLRQVTEDHSVVAQLLKAGQLFDQLVPPSCETPATSPWDPPSDQRSCCQKPTRSSEFRGFTRNHGSTSVPGKFSPATSDELWKPSPGPPQPGPNGLLPELASFGPVVV